MIFLRQSWNRKPDLWGPVWAVQSNIRHVSENMFGHAAPVLYLPFWEGAGSTIYNYGVGKDAISVFGAPTRYADQLLLGGSGDYLSALNSYVLEASDFTVIIDIVPSTVIGNDKALWSVGDTATDTGGTFICHRDIATIKYLVNGGGQGYQTFGDLHTNRRNSVGVTRDTTTNTSIGYLGNDVGFTSTDDGVLTTKDTTFYVGSGYNGQVDGGLLSVKVYNFILTPDQIAAHHEQPYAEIQRVVRPSYFFVAGAGGADALTASDIVSGTPAVGTPTIGQSHTLSASNIATGSPDVGVPTVGQSHGLTATAITTAVPTVAVPSIGQVHTLTAPGIATAAPEIDTAIIGQTHAMAASGVYAGAAVVGTPTLAEGVDALTASDITVGTSVVESPTIGQTHTLSPVGISGGTPDVATPTIGQVHELSATDITTGQPAIGAPTLAEGAYALTASGITTGPISIGTPWLGQVHGLSPVAIAAAAAAVGNPSLDYSAPTTPAERICTVAAEARIFTVPAEARIFTI